MKWPLQMPAEKLLFIDTNIWLDFYRARNDTGLKLLKQVEALTARLADLSLCGITPVAHIWATSSITSIGRDQGGDPPPFPPTPSSYS